jgi:acetone carboxylase gamma subunit
MDVKRPLLERMGVRTHLMMCRYGARFRRRLTMLRIKSRLADPVPSAIGEREYLCEEVRKRITNALLASL